MEYYNIHELYGQGYKGLSGPICNVFEQLCDQATPISVPYNAYNDPVAARICNKRKQSSTSLKQMLHYAEIFGNNEFRQFDYGTKDENSKKYGEELVDSKPPLIDLRKITLTEVPIALYVGK